NYAQLIQEATLTSAAYLKNALNDHFVLFKPRDVVSGDFYWCHSSAEKVIWAACDCTGHGVPGAFMSLIGISLLDEVAVEKKITDAHEILNHVKKGILDRLGEKGASGERKDGMDCGLCVWDKTIPGPLPAGSMDSRKDENYAGKLQFAGAYNPLFLMRKGIGKDLSGFQNLSDLGVLKLHNENFAEICADKMTVGYQENKIGVSFTKKEIQLQKGDVLYTFSDGFHDQFGGPKGKKFSHRRFRELLYSVHDRPMSEQRDMLEKTIEEWKSFPGQHGGHLEQVDDICVIGVRV
ncbi:MAG: SpoIIE family protein phosphatase, partial [Bacteroidota bacterium]